MSYDIRHAITSHSRSQNLNVYGIFDKQYYVTWWLCPLGCAGVISAQYMELCHLMKRRENYKY